MDWPAYPLVPIDGLVTVDLQSIASLGGLGTGGLIGSDQPWPGANYALFLPVRLASPMVVARVFWRNGTVVGANVDLGIYDEQGARLFSLGSTAQGAVSSTIEVDVADTPVGPGLLYVAFVCDSGTARIWQTTIGGAAWFKCCGIAAQAAALPLPVKAILVSPTLTTGLPYCGFTARSVL
jgi:hypothetical protein